MKKIATLMLAIVLTLVWGGSAAHAETDLIQKQVERVLVEYPGGTQTGVGEITWNGGEVVLNLFDESSTRAAVGSCASGYFCGYTSTGLTGSQISFSSCTAPNQVAPLGSPVRSVANGRGAGNVFAFNGGSPVLSVSANSWSNTSATITRLGC